MVAAESRNMPPKKKAGKEDSKAVACEPVIKAEADLLSLRRLLELKTYEVSILYNVQRAYGQQPRQFELQQASH